MGIFWEVLLNDGSELLYINIPIDLLIYRKFRHPCRSLYLIGRVEMFTEDEA